MLPITTPQYARRESEFAKSQLYCIIFFGVGMYFYRYNIFKRTTVGKMVGEKD